MAQVTVAAPFNLRSDARHAAAEEKLAARQAEVSAAEKRAASFKVGVVPIFRLASNQAKQMCLQSSYQLILP